MSRFSKDQSTIESLYNLAWYHSDGSLDRNAAYYFVKIVTLEVLETLAYTQIPGINIAIAGRTLSYGGKVILGLGIGSLISSYKEGQYHILISQHISPNSKENMIEIWNNSYGHKAYDFYTAEYLSKALGQLDTGTYQFGNVLKGGLGGGIKMLGGLVSVFKGNYGLVPYLLMQLYSYYYIGPKVNELFRKSKELDVEINNKPFQFHSDIQHGLQAMKEKIACKKTIDKEMTYYQMFATLTGISHYNLANKGGISKIKELAFNTEEKESSKYATTFSETTYIAEWLRSNYMRVIELQHRAEMTKKYINMLLDDAPIKNITSAGDIDFPHDEL